MSDETEKMVWRPALVIGGESTPRQRERNYDLYKRLRDGVPEAERHGLRGGPLHEMVFEVPHEDVSFHRGFMSFRLRPDGECFRRLLSCILDATPTRDPVDDEVKRLRAEVERCHPVISAVADWFNDQARGGEFQYLNRRALMEAYTTYEQTPDPLADEDTK